MTPGAAAEGDDATAAAAAAAYLIGGSEGCRVGCGAGAGAGTGVGVACAAGVWGTGADGAEDVEELALLGVGFSTDFSVDAWLLTSAVVFRTGVFLAIVGLVGLLGAVDGSSLWPALDVLMGVRAKSRITVKSSPLSVRARRVTTFFQYSPSLTLSRSLSPSGSSL